MQAPRETVILVSCVKEKRVTRALAKDLYIVPMAGLRIGEQMAWLGQRTHRPGDGDEPLSEDLLSWPRA